MTVGQMLSTISSREIAEWRQYFLLEQERIERMNKEQPKAMEARLGASLRGYKRGGH